MHDHNFPSKERPMYIPPWLAERIRNPSEDEKDDPAIPIAQRMLEEGSLVETETLPDADVS